MLQLIVPTKSHGHPQWRSDLGSEIPINIQQHSKVEGRWMLYLRMLFILQALAEAAWGLQSCRSWRCSGT